MIRTFLIFLVWFSIVPHVAGDMIYVNATNTGTEDGLTQATGFNTIQEGVDNSSSGDTVFVLLGTYGAVTLNKTINLTGEVGSIINGAGSGRGISVNITNAGNTNISGFEITNWAFGVHVYDVNAGDANLIIMDNNISSNNDKGIFLRIGTGGVIISNNTIDNNTGGIGISCSSNNTIVNNTVTNNSLFGFDYSGSSCTDDWPTNNTIEGNIFRENTEAGIYMVYTEDNTIHNNTVDNNIVSGIQLGHAYDNTFTNNTIRNNGVNSQCGVFLSDSINNTFRWSTIANNSFADVCAYGGANYNNTVRDSTVDVISIREIRNTVNGTVESTSTVADAHLKVSSNGTEFSVELNITKYTDPKGLGIDVLNATSPLGKYLDFTSSMENISNVIITMYYTDEDMIDILWEILGKEPKQGKIDEFEASIMPYCWNESTSSWDELTTQLSWVNSITKYMDDNKIVLNISHMSMYVLGMSSDEPEEPPPPSNGGGTVKRKVTLLANSIDYNLSGELRGHLKSNGMDIIYTTPENFSDYTDSKFIVILGGPDAYDGVGEVVQGILDESEQAFLRVHGNRKMYIKTNVWKRGQVVMVIAGSDREETRKAGEENKLAVRKKIKGY